MRKIILAVSLTLLLGPGVGHLYLRKYKKAFYLFIFSLFFALHFAWQISRNISKTEILNINMPDLFKNFYAQHHNLTILYDIIFALLWGYAIVDTYLEARKSV